MSLGYGTQNMGAPYANMPNLGAPQMGLPNMGAPRPGVPNIGAPHTGAPSTGVGQSLLGGLSLGKLPFGNLIGSLPFGNMLGNLGTSWVPILLIVLVVLPSLTRMGKFFNNNLIWIILGLLVLLPYFKK